MELNNNFSLINFIKPMDSSQFHSFCFQTTFFFRNTNHDTSTVPPNAVNKFLNSQVLINRLNYIVPIAIRTKYVAKALSANILGNHRILQSINRTEEFAVDVKLGLSFHYRREPIPFYANFSTIPDLTARKFGPDLWPKVDAVCGNIFEDGVCPS